jgi:uncharacterized protein (TIGR00251 family)
MIQLEQLEGRLRPISDCELALTITVKPGQRNEGILLDSAGQIVVKVKAPAQEGRANERLIEIVAQALGCPKRNISVSRGQSSRHKELRIQEYRLTKGR